MTLFDAALDGCSAELGTVLALSVRVVCWVGRIIAPGLHAHTPCYIVGLGLHFVAFSKHDGGNSVDTAMYLTDGA